MKSLILILMIVLASCTPTAQPTPDQLASADYGASPILSEIPSMVRKLLKEIKYYDPNGAEIEDCQIVDTGYITGIDVMSYYEKDYDKFFFGYNVTCDVNSKNRMGGYTGFETYRYFIKDNTCLSGETPFTRDGILFQ